MNYPIYIKNTNGVFVELPTPTGLEVQVEDVSRSDAGRTEDVTMHKNRIGRTARFDVSYKNTNTEKVTTALTLVKPEYFSTIYMDLELGGVYVCAPMYRGNPKASVYNGANDIWSNCAFPIITQRGTEPKVCLSTQTVTSITPPYAEIDTSILPGSNITCSIINKTSLVVVWNASSSRLIYNNRNGIRSVAIFSDEYDNFFMVYVRT